MKKLEEYENAWLVTELREAELLRRGNGFNFVKEVGRITRVFPSCIVPVIGTNLWQVGYFTESDGPGTVYIDSELKAKVEWKGGRA